MKRSIFGAVALAAVALIVVSVATAATPVTSGVTSNGFETNTAGWFDSANYDADFGTITREASGSTNPGGYASPVASATGGFHARLTRTTCDTVPASPPGTPVDTLNCAGPFTDWGNRYKYQWNGAYTTQVDIYLDTAYAIAHPDVYPDSNGNPGSTQPGNIAGLSLDATPAGTPATPTVPGTRFDYTSAINASDPVVFDPSDPNPVLVGHHKRDFGFNVSTGTTDDDCEGFVVNGTTNVLRSGANPNVAATRQCISQPGWYTFKHSFSDDAGFLKVQMDIIPVGGSTPTASWTIHSGDAISTVGCNRYGWFAEQEIWGLPIDNAKIEGGCAAPVITDGQILPTGTTCQAYDAGALPLEKVQYTLTKGGNINSVAPGVFFYYGTISGNEGDEFTITQENDSSAPFIPVQHGQVILYDEDCNVVKWNPTTDADGEVTGTLPYTGTFIISVKYSASALKGVPDPGGTVEYTIDGATVVFAKK